MGPTPGVFTLAKTSPLCRENLRRSLIPRRDEGPIFKTPIAIGAWLDRSEGLGHLDLLPVYTATRTSSVAQSHSCDANPTSSRNAAAIPGRSSSLSTLVQGRHQSLAVSGVLGVVNQRRRATFFDPELASSLTGRHFSVELFPFDFAEFRSLCPDAGLLDYLHEGGLTAFLARVPPAPVLC
jgi:hypothetical protein